LPDVRYVCLSDLHFGAENSILTDVVPDKVIADPSRPSRAMTALVACLDEIVSHNQGGTKPTLILCGDILELALTTDNIAAMVFDRFVELAFPPSGSVFDSTVWYLPGNHDHHIWETARERQYAQYLRRRPLAEPLENPWHTTRMFTEHDPDWVDAELLTTLMRRHPHLQDVTVRAVYPNLGISSPDGRKCVVFHHGHFLESIYRLMSVVKDYMFPNRDRPQSVWEIEAENFAWIDFFWSTLGRSGEVGSDVGFVYASFQSDEAMDRLAHNLARGIKEHMHGHPIRATIESWALEPVIRHFARRIGEAERAQPTPALTPGAQEELKRYIDGPLYHQLRAEDRSPESLTFVFGHTHKPFQQPCPTERFPRGVHTYNTGGWVVDTLDPVPLQGGAAVLVDENLDAASLHLYQQRPDDSDYRVTVEQAEGQDGGEFLRRLRSIVEPGGQPWAEFSAAAAQLVRQRHADLRNILDRGGVTGAPRDR